VLLGAGRLAGVVGENGGESLNEVIRLNEENPLLDPKLLPRENPVGGVKLLLRGEVLAGVYA
jgi:hypothetical protein